MVVGPNSPMLARLKEKYSTFAIQVFSVVTSVDEEYCRVLTTLCSTDLPMESMVLVSSWARVKMKKIYSMQ